MLDFQRQAGLVKQDLISQVCTTVIGQGAVGSFTTLALVKLGVQKLEVFDDDIVAPHNLPNQFFKMDEIDNHKVTAAYCMAQDYAGVNIIPHKRRFVAGDKVGSVLIVSADNMAARKLAWETFKKSEQCVGFIDARMGGELAIVYRITRTLDPKTGSLILNENDIKFYEGNLFPDEQMEPIPCSAKAIIYNVMLLAGLVCRAFKAIMNNEKQFPREIIFDVKNMIFMERV